MPFFSTCSRSAVLATHICKSENLAGRILRLLYTLLMFGIIRLSVTPTNGKSWLYTLVGPPRRLSRQGRRRWVWTMPDGMARVSAVITRKVCSRRLSPLGDGSSCRSSQHSRKLFLHRRCGPSHLLT